MKGKIFISPLLIMSFTSLVFAFAKNDVKAQVQTLEQKKEIKKLDRKSVRKILNLPASAFRPTFDEFKFKNNSNELSRRKDAKWLACSFQAPVSLPDGARLEEITMYCKDNSRAINVELYLRKIANDSTEIEDIAKVNSYGSDEKIRRFQTSQFVNSIIDNINYFYYLHLSLQGDLVFKGAKIVYSVLE